VEEPGAEESKFGAVLVVLAGHVAHRVTGQLWPVALLRLRHGRRE